MTGPDRPARQCCQTPLLPSLPPRPRLPGCHCC
jgi:hypothetical protein